MIGLGRAFALSLLPVLAGCATLNVQSDFEHDTDFSGYHSFAFLPSQAPGPDSPSLDPLDNEIVARRVQRGIREALEARGYRLTDVGDADFWVAYHVASSEKVEVRNYPYGGGYGGFYGHHGGGLGLYGGGSYTRRYQEGALVVHIVDARENQLVWHGWATDRLPKGNPTSGRIERGLVAILDQFPPTAAGG